MKPLLKFLLCIAMMIAMAGVSLIEAAAWQMDSSPFSFSGTSVTGKNMRSASADASVRCLPNVNKGIVTILCSLPAGAKSGMLKIYTLSGVLVHASVLHAGTSTVHLSTSQRITTGIYYAALQYGNVEKTTQISIVK